MAKFDSLQNHEFRRDEWAARERDGANTQPAPNAGGKWSVRDFDYHQYGDVTLNETKDGVTVAFAYMQGRGQEAKQRAAQIVAEHNAVGLLVAALQDLIHQLPTDKQLADFNLDLAESALAAAGK
jgi:hypothetical protein